MQVVLSQLFSSNFTIQSIVLTHLNSLAEVDQTFSQVLLRGQNLGKFKSNLRGLLLLQSSLEEYTGSLKLTLVFVQVAQGLVNERRMEFICKALQKLLLSYQEKTKSPISLSTQVEYISMLYILFKNALFKELLHLLEFLSVEVRFSFYDEAINFLKEILLRHYIGGLWSDSCLIILE